jgi:hypothetical protein
MRKFIISFVIVTCLLSSFSGSAFAQGTAFSYQGRLNSSGNAANGSYDLTFAVFATNSGGSSVAGPITNSAIGVSNGLFTVSLDFGSGVFTGNALWLELGVRTNGSGSFTTLAPRQPILPTPYAIMASSASNLLGTLPAAQLSGTLPSSVLTGYSGTVTLTNGGNSFNGSFSGSFGGNGAGLTGVPGTIIWQTVSGTSQQAQPNTGYIVNNSAQVTITLPTSPNVGDIVRVSGVGAGGWKIAQYSGQSVLVGNVAALSVGASWIAQNSGSRNWEGVASSADGSKLVACVYNGQIYTSTDSGVTWTARDSSRGWQWIASSSDCSKTVACVYGGQIYTSTNSGTTWAPQGLTNNWGYIASSADGSKLVACVGPGQIYTSTNSGTTWAPQGLSTNWGVVASSADGSKLVACIYGGQIYTSTNSGVVWISQNSGSHYWIAVASSADGSKLVACEHNGQIYTSTDSGVTWTARDSSRGWENVASSADGSKLVACVYGGQIYTSTDSGVTWIPQNSGSGNWGSLASSADGSKLVAGVYGGQIYTSSPALASPSSTTTVGTGGFICGGLGALIELQYAGNNQFIVLSYAGTIFGY